MNRSSLLPKLTIALLTALAACQATLTEPQEGPAPGIRNPNAPVRFDTAVVLDRSLESWTGAESQRYAKIAVEKVGGRPTATGTVQVFAVLRNRTNFPLQVEARVQFFDAGEVPLGEPSAWQRVFLPAQAVGAYEETSLEMADLAKHYYIEIREGR